MGDRIEIRDSVVMGNVGSVSGGTSPLSCSMCRKMGNIVLNHCESCNIKFCDDCRDSTDPEDWRPFRRCSECGKKMREEIEWFVKAIGELLEKYEVYFGIDPYYLSRAFDFWYHSGIKTKILHNYFMMVDMFGNVGTLDDIESILKADSSEDAKKLCLSSDKSDWPAILEKGRLEKNQRELEIWKAETREKWKNVLLNEWTVIFIVFVLGMIWFRFRDY